jgi:hypothetical protein
LLPRRHHEDGVRFLGVEDAMGDVGEGKVLDDLPLSSVKSPIE